jgi:hypothetical protein
MSFYSVKVCSESQHQTLVRGGQGRYTFMIHNDGPRDIIDCRVKCVSHPRFIDLSHVVINCKQNDIAVVEATFIVPRNCPLKTKQVFRLCAPSEGKAGVTFGPLLTLLFTARFSKMTDEDKEWQDGYGRYGIQFG